jgi:hypothetical protein
MATRKTARKQATVTDAPILNGRVLSARPDTVDFRDLMYVPTLVEVPSERPLADFVATNPLILDQGVEGACTGFALAAVANHLLQSRKVHPDPTPVSSRMFYEMAKRHDEWPGEEYSGSSARGAMKGWHKFGVCSEKAWPYRPGKTDRDASSARLRDAGLRPLGAYFRVNHRDLVAMHSAITETGILYATSMVHKGWDSVTSNGVIHYKPGVLGGHAFALVGYDSKGFWIQNSWGPKWGKQGFAHLSYEDWLENGTDVWVARLGVPVVLDSARAFSSSTFAATRMGQGVSYAEIRPHVVSVGNNGIPSGSGDFANTPAEIREMVLSEFPRITSGWSKKRILLYAHGGLVAADNAIQRVAEYRATMLGSQVYPLAFVWNSDFWSTLKNILADAVRRRRSEGIIDRAKDFMLDRLDDTLEPIARTIGGKAQWAEMKENALAATQSRNGAAAIVLDCLRTLVAADPSIEIHIAGHSAGSIFMAPVVSKLRTIAPIQTCHLWAPACTMDLFRSHYLPSLQGNNPSIRSFALYTLTDAAEQDDHCAHVYHKSLLYLVSRAFEDEYRPFKWGWPGAPLLGMEKFVRTAPDIMALFRRPTATWILAPNSGASGILSSSASSHGAFDDDIPTVKGTLARILGSQSHAANFDFTRSASARKDARMEIQSIK